MPTSSTTEPGKRLVVEGDCRTEPYPWENPNRTPPACEKGTHGCRAKHSVRRDGTRCRRHAGDGGHYTCPDSDRVAFTCTNYAGRWPG